MRQYLKYIIYIIISIRYFFVLKDVKLVFLNYFDMHGLILFFVLYIPLFLIYAGTVNHVDSDERHIILYILVSILVLNLYSITVNMIQYQSFILLLCMIGFIIFLIYYFTIDYKMASLNALISITLVSLIFGMSTVFSYISYYENSLVSNVISYFDSEEELMTDQQIDYIQFIEDFEDEESEFLNRDCIKIQAYNNDESHQLGYYYEGTIYLNCALLKDGKDYLYTYLHESYHAKQYEMQDDHYTKDSYLNSIQQNYIQELLDYKSVNENASNYEEYALQSLEIDANNYAKFRYESLKKFLPESFQ